MRHISGNEVEDGYEFIVKLSKEELNIQTYSAPVIVLLGTCTKLVDDFSGVLDEEGAGGVNGDSAHTAAAIPGIGLYLGFDQFDDVIDVAPGADQRSYIQNACPYFVLGLDEADHLHGLPF